ELISSASHKTIDLVASFQYTVVEELVQHCIQAASAKSVNSVFVTGGVAANSALRERFQSFREKLPPVFFPRLHLSTDNAAMIAAAAYPKFLAGEFAGWDTPVDASLALESVSPAPISP